MKADVELRVGKRERDGLPLVYTMDAKWIALDSTNEEGPTFARRCTSVSAVVDMGSSEACELILDAASPEVNPADDDGWNIQILRAWNKEGVELDPETLEPLPATSQPGLSQFPVVGSDPIWGDIIEVPTVYGEKTRVARAQLEDSSRNVLAQYTKAGKRKPGYGINRGNLLIGGAELADFARLEKEMRESGQWEVARNPRSPEQQMKLLGQGYTGYLRDERTGEMIPSTAVRAVKNSVSYATGKKAMRHAMAESGITDPNEQAAFMAQMDHESAGFTRLEENLSYSPKQFLKMFGARAGINTEDEAKAILSKGPEATGEAMYGGAWGARNLGNTEPGDGHKFRGRGYTQLTGRSKPMGWRIGRQRPRSTWLKPLAAA